MPTAASADPPREAPIADGGDAASAAATGAVANPGDAATVATPPEPRPLRDAGQARDPFQLAFDRERRDEPWSTDLEQRLRRDLATIPDTEVAVLECRTTVCKLWRGIRLTGRCTRGAARSSLPSTAS